MTDIVSGFHRRQDPATALLAACRFFLNYSRQARLRKRCRPRPLRGIDAEIRRQAARYVPDHLRRDLGLDPDSL